MEKGARNLKNLKFHVHTFGCQMNKNDSERIAGILSNAGSKISNSPEESDIIIVNTCAVREKSEEKLYSYLGRLATSKKKKKTTIGVVGCVAQLYGSELLEKKPFIDFILGPDNYNHISEIIQSNHEEKFTSTSWSRDYNEIPHEMIFRESNISAYVTIMEGCNNFCSYCIVPFTRGREKCRPLQKIKKDFSILLKEANLNEGIEWIRFITSHPKNFTKNIATAMKDAEKVCHQLHLPVQSGASSVLKKMNRGYTREEYIEKITFLRNLMPDISFSTDIIAGFPGETEEEFQETLSILEEVRFNNIFSFRYSPRPFTLACREKDTVPFEEKKSRLIEVQELQKKIQLELNKSLIGRVLKVLCSGKSKKAPRLYSGRNEGYQVVNFKSKNNVIGCFVDVRITSCGPYSLRGEAVKQSD